METVVHQICNPRYLLRFIDVLYLQAPRTSRAGLVKGRAQANAVAQQQALIAHWQNIVKSLNNYLNTMKANYVSEGAPDWSCPFFLDRHSLCVIENFAGSFIPNSQDLQANILLYQCSTFQQVICC